MALWLVLAALVAGLAAIRLAPNAPARWHADPLTAPDPGTRNFARIPAGEITGDDVASLAQAADDAMRSLPRTVLLAGTVEAGHMTYLTRSLIMGYPDFTSIRVVPVDGGATLAAFSRSRFGELDFGVNAARVAALRAALAAR